MARYGGPEDAFFPWLKWRTKDSVFELLFRERGQLLSTRCGEAEFAAIDVRTFVDTELECMLREPTTYTDVKEARWIQWLLDVDDCNMTVW